MQRMGAVAVQATAFERNISRNEAMITRRSLFGLALVPMMPKPAPVKSASFLKPGHRTADPCMLTADHGLVRFRDMKNCKLYVMQREEWDGLWFDGRMMHIPE